MAVVDCMEVEVASAVAAFTVAAAVFLGAAFREAASAESARLIGARIEAWRADRALSAPPADPAVMATTRTVVTAIRETGASVGLVQFVRGQRARPFRRRLVSPLTLTVSGISLRARAAALNRELGAQAMRH